MSPSSMTLASHSVMTPAQSMGPAVQPPQAGARPAWEAAAWLAQSKRQRPDMGPLVPPQTHAQVGNLGSLPPPPGDFFMPQPSYPVRGRSPLHQAVLGNQFDRAKQLVAQGADVNARDSNGETPLHCAAECDFIHMLELLLWHGADPFAVDNLGDTPMHAAAAGGKSGTAILLVRSMQGSPRPLPMWPNAQHVRAVLNSFQPSQADANRYAAVDRLMHELTGSVANLNNDFDVLKYVGHLLSLNDMVVCLPAEGWNQVGFFYQRLRSFVSMFLNPAPLPEDLQGLLHPEEARKLVEREIVGMLTSLNVMRHVRDTRRLNEPPRHAICALMAEQIMNHLAGLRHGEGFTLPLGLPSHAIYMNLMPQQVGERAVMTFRLDNLGLGSEVATSKDARGRVPPFAFNLPMEYLATAAGKARLGELLAQLLFYLTDPQIGIDMVYAQLTLLLRELHGAYPTALIDAVDQDKYARDPQTVGNCSLKNHSAGVWTRLAMAIEAKVPNAPPQVQHSLGATLWRWVSKQEILLALGRMHEFVITPKALLYRHQELKGEQLRKLIDNDQTHGQGDIDAFLTHPFRERVAATLIAEDVQSLVAEGQVDDLKALLAHGFNPLSDPAVPKDGTLLHTAVRSESPRAADMVHLLLAHGALPTSVDGRGRTPFMLAAQLGRTEAMAVLAPFTSPADRQAALPALAAQLQDLQRTLGLLTGTAPAPSMNPRALQAA